MSRPKFTPDPPPITPNEVEAEWFWRQLQRIEDWWPKDYGDRLRALEGLAPYKSGTWPIVDSSFVSLAASAEAVAGFANFIAQSNRLYKLSDDFQSVESITGPGTINAEKLWTDGNQTYYAVSERELYYTTNNGSSWTSFDFTDGGYTWAFGPAGVEYYDGNWYAFCHGKTVQSQGLYVFRSSDFVNWTKIYSRDTGSGPGAEMGAIAHDGFGNWLIATSTTDSLWYVDNNDFDNMYEDTTNVNSRYTNKASYANGIWYLSGSRQKLVTSPDRDNWTIRYQDNSLTTAQMGRVTYGNGVWLVNTYNGYNRLLRSIDGETFSVIDSSWAETNNVEAIYIVGLGWLAGGQALAGQFNLATSTDNGDTWLDFSPTNFDAGDINGLFRSEIITV